MKDKIYVLTVFLLLTFSDAFSQTVINTESTLNKIDSTFHLFLDAMGDYQKGNIELANTARYTAFELGIGQGGYGGSQA